MSCAWKEAATGRTSGARNVGLEIASWPDSRTGNMFDLSAGRAFKELCRIPIWCLEGPVAEPFATAAGSSTTPISKPSASAVSILFLPIIPVELDAKCWQLL